MESNQANLVPEIRTLVKNLLDRSETDAVIHNDESLVIAGRMSSLQLVELAAELERNYAIDFSDGFNQYDFDTVDSIVRMITSKQKNS